MEPSHNQPVASTSKPWVTSFFPLQKLKGSQLATTPSAWVVHLEKKSTNKEECIDSEVPDDIRGVTERVHCTPCQSSERHSAGGEALLPL